VLLSCGEPSGDLYAGALTRELRALAPGIDVGGLGGPQFAAAGGRLIADYRGLSVTGLTEAIPKLPHLLAVRRALVASVTRNRPDVLVVVDFPDFNIRLASRVKKLGIRVVYYVSPQIWAWRPGRLKSIRAFADRVLVIFPFEERIYRDAGIPVEFVGHPLVELMQPTIGRLPFLERLDLRPDAPTVALLPGSRSNEVARILPDLAAAAAAIRRTVPSAQFVVARAPNLEDALFASVRTLAQCAIVEGETDSVLAAADAAIVASGTATVQAALHNTPMVVVYRLSPMTYRLVRPLVRVQAVAMVNLIAGQKIVPELIQDAFTPDAAANETVTLLTNPRQAAAVRQQLAEVRRRLGAPGASRRAAEAILTVMGR
jgi:lipid-A-disaccharide synthase